MAVPVQTWGALGTMVEEQKKFGTKTSEWLEEKEVYDLFGYLLRQVIIHQPSNPVKFLQEQLKVRPPLAVCVIGPPGMNRQEYCSKIAQDYSITHIRVGQLLRDTKDAEVKAVMESGELVDDALVMKVVHAELKKNRSKGWVLDGFPRTRVQAQSLALKEVGFCVDKILLLNTSEQILKDTFRARAARSALGGGADPEARLQQYQRHVVSIAELFKNVIRQIEVTAGEDDELGKEHMKTIINSTLHVRPYSNAPLRPPRICVTGSCGAGMTTQCKAVARHYGLVHVDLAPLIKKYQKASGKVVEDLPAEFLSDEELCGIVGKRLNEIDCVRKGWVLDGFPRNEAQAQFLRQSHLWPSRLIVLEVGANEAVDRVGRRQVDPNTCIAYYKSPNNVIVRQRLVRMQHDEPDAVQGRWKLFADAKAKMMQVFPLVTSEIRGEGDEASVTAGIKGKIDSPLPSEMGQNPDYDM
jgi:adenylate kinase